MGNPAHNVENQIKQVVPSLMDIVKYHKYLRGTHPFYNKVELTTMN
jgi:hypothetical protein